MSKSADHTDTEPKASLPVVGWREKVSLPDWGIEGLRAKIDTGARTSAIHVRALEYQENGNVQFDVVIREKPTRLVRRVEATPVRESVVKPSSGIRQRRLVCTTTMKIGDHESEIEISLVSRKGMLCRMLVGRTALEGHFLVDSSKKYLQKPKKHSGKKAKP